VLSKTVTEKLQLGPACVLQVTDVVPTGKNEPEAGEQDTVPQPALEVGEKLTVVPHDWLGFVPTVMLPGQLMVQGTTVTVNEQLESGLSGLESEAVQVTVVVPAGKQKPEGGEQTTVALPQLSVAVGDVYVTAWQPPLDTVLMLAGHAPMVGACVSLTVTVNEQEAELLDASVTEQFTVVTPCGKEEPEAGEQLGDPTPGQLSLAVGDA
jgi:hypothetical protein